VDPAGFSNLPKVLSAPRLAPYVGACGGDARKAVRLYTWNVEVSSAFWGAVHVLEVALRNAEHEQMAARYGRPDWWNDGTVYLHAVMQKQLAQAKVDASKAAHKNQRAAMPDDVVAALTFGFWSGLLGPGGSLQYETQFWQPFLKNAFRRYAGSRAALHRDVDSLRLFRNRLAHH